MDPITHLLSGSLLSRSGFGNRYGGVATFALIIGAIFPDIDVFLLIFVDRWTAYKHHRGLTHSLLGILIFSLILALLIYLFSDFKKYWHLVGFLSLGMLVHVTLDLFTSWGTQIFYPFTDKPYSLDFISIIDFYFTLIILIFLLISGRLKKKGARFARIGFITLGLYLSLCIACHFTGYMKFIHTISEIEEKPIRISVLPGFRSGPFGWRAVAETEYNFYRSKNFLIFSHHIPFKKYKKEPPNKYVEIASQLKEVKIFLWFAKYPYIKTIDYPNKHIVSIWDLRFGGPEGGSSFDIQITLNDEGKVLEINN